MGLIARHRARFNVRCALHWLRLRYWYLDTEEGRKAQVGVFVAAVLLTIVQVVSLVVSVVTHPDDEPIGAVWPVWVVQLIIMVISAIISYLLAPKPEPPKPADGDAPTVEDGRAMPEVHGTVWIDDEFILAHKVVGRVPIKSKGKK
ncbi:MAG: hypothetical protein ACOH2M_23305 [Cypionkella sp.]